MHASCGLDLGTIGQLGTVGPSTIHHWFLVPEAMAGKYTIDGN